MATKMRKLSPLDPSKMTFNPGQTKIKYKMDKNFLNMLICYIFTKSRAITKANLISIRKFFDYLDISIYATNVSLYARVVFIQKALECILSKGTERKDLIIDYCRMENDPETQDIIDNIPQKGYMKYTGDDEYLKSLSESQLQNLQKEEKEYLELLKQKYGDDEYLIRYIKNSTTDEYVPYFYKKSDLQQANYDQNGNSQSNINCYTIGSETKAEEVKAVEGCKLEKDSSGRYINITIPSADGKTEVTYMLTTTTVTDQDAYEDAMNQYEFDKQEYDQAIDQINAKIEIIQAQDKNLELRLKQLDTEQDAIQTEMDAVQKVIEKNTESTFKTFG